MSFNKCYSGECYGFKRKILDQEFISKNGQNHAILLLCFEAKWPSLKLKTQPKQPLALFLFVYDHNNIQ